MKVLRNFHFLCLVLATLLICVFASSALALTTKQLAEIKEVAQTGSLSQIEAVTKKIVEAAIKAGEDPAAAAQQATKAAVSVASPESIAAIAQAASSGVTSGAVAATAITSNFSSAADLNEAVAAVVKAASSGAAFGAISGATPENLEEVARAASFGATEGAVASVPPSLSKMMAKAASSGATSGAVESAKSSGKNPETAAKASEQGSKEGLDTVQKEQQQPAEIPGSDDGQQAQSSEEKQVDTPAEPEAFEPAAPTPPALPAPPALEPPPTQDNGAASPI